MYLDLGRQATLFHALLLIDRDLAAQCRQGGCPHCGGPLHRSDYPRKPRGCLEWLDDEVYLRLSLCCGREGCRSRTIPSSCRFFGRKVYFAAVVLVVVTMRQRRPGSASAARLRAAFGVSWETVLRWMSFSDEVFPRTTTWKRLRGSVHASVGDDDLPAGLLEVMIEQAGDRREGLPRCLQLLSVHREVCRSYVSRKKKLLVTSCAAFALPRESPGGVRRLGGATELERPRATSGW